MIRLSNSARALLAVLSTFVTGVAVGCGLDRTVLAPPSFAAAAAGQRGMPHHDEVLAELRTELGLTAEQAARVQEIFASHQTEIEGVWAQIHANLQRAMQQTTKEIETVLDSAQVTRLHAWLAERHGPTHGRVSGRQH